MNSEDYTYAGKPYNKYDFYIEEHDKYPPFVLCVFLDKSDIEALKKIKEKAIHDNFDLYVENNETRLYIRESFNKIQNTNSSIFEIKAWEFTISKNLYRVLTIVKSLKYHISLYEFVHEILKQEEIYERI